MCHGLASPVGGLDFHPSPEGTLAMPSSKRRSIAVGFALVVLGLFAAPSAHAQALISYSASWSFETPQNRDWSFTPNNDPREPGTLAGYDINKDLGKDGSADEVFADLSDPLWFGAASTPIINPNPNGFGATEGQVIVDFWTQMSSPDPDYVMNVWDAETWTVIQQLPIAWSGTYAEHHFDVTIDNAIANRHHIVVQFGFQGSGELQWMRLDDVSVQVVITVPHT
jgi:hypothetical protein